MSFHDVKITGMDQQATRPSGVGKLYDVVLNLSPIPPSDWSEIFDHYWKHHMYMMKRSATTFGSIITVQCMPEELEGGLLNELKKVVAQTNQQFKVHIGDVEAHEQAQRDKAAQERERISGLAGRLNFD